MSREGLVRFGALSAMVGGVLWGGAFTVAALRPPPLGEYRDDMDLVPYVVAGIALITIGVVGHTASRNPGVGRGLAMLAAFANLAGASIFLAFAFRLHENWDLIGSAVYLLTSSFMVVGLSLFQGSARERSLGVLLILSSIAALYLDMGDQRAWLGVPLGVVWLALGFTAWTNELHRRTAAAVA